MCVHTALVVLALFKYQSLVCILPIVGILPFLLVEIG